MLWRINFSDIQRASAQIGSVVSTAHFWDIVMPGARPTNGISIEFEIRPKFAVIWFRMYSTDHNEILRTSRQCNCNCRDVCKISLWSVEHILSWNTPLFLTNFEFDRNIDSGTGASSVIGWWHHDSTQWWIIYGSAEGSRRVVKICNTPYVIRIT